MNASFVVGCTVAMAWLFHDEATVKTAELRTRLATETALVPAWWFVEITNVLALAERKGRISPAQSSAFLADLASSTSNRTARRRRARSHICCRCAARTDSLSFRRRRGLLMPDQPSSPLYRR